MERSNSTLKSENHELTRENEMLRKTLRNLEQENQALILEYNKRCRQLYQEAATAVVNNPGAAANQAPSSIPDPNQPSTSSNSNSNYPSRTKAGDIWPHLDSSFCFLCLNTI